MGELKKELLCVSSPPQLHRPATQPSPAEKGWQRAGSHSSTDCASAPVRPPTRRRRAMPPGGELCWKMSFLTAFAVLYVRVSSPLPPRRAGSRGRAAAAAPPRASAKWSGAAPDASSSSSLQIDAAEQHLPAMLGRGSAVTQTSPHPQNPSQGAALGLSCVNYKMGLLWGCVFSLDFSPSRGPGRVGGGCGRLVPWASSLPK